MLAWAQGAWSSYSHPATHTATMQSCQVWRQFLQFFVPSLGCGQGKAQLTFIRTRPCFFIPQVLLQCVSQRMIKLHGWQYKT
eukprot:2282531-Amphidinium_carterae.1